MTGEPVPDGRAPSRGGVVAAAGPVDGPVEVVPALPIGRLLVANRGELVARIARTCRAMGIACLALATDDQRATWWARQADEVVVLPGAYVDAAAVVRAAVDAGADAIHPGYGFLAERAEFAEAVIAAGLAWVGPPPSAMRALGDKAGARALAIAAGVPVLAGFAGDDGAGRGAESGRPGGSDAALAREAERIGYPLLVKPSAGGGGTGMHLVRDPADLGSAVALARREATAAFGDGRVMLERFLEGPRHVEVQVVRDAHGTGVALGERDCSLQRRHQKVVEEAPAPDLPDETRRRLASYALALAAAAGYTGAGTAEFLVADDGTLAFLEFNARLQVEHPVTELVTGLDLIELQLRIAGGEPLPFGQADVRCDGHATEARLYAEEPAVDFVPSTGTVAAVAWPSGPGIRVDAGIGTGDVIGTRYDPLLAKIIAHGPDRRAALDRLAEALAATRVFGVTTNRGWLGELLAAAPVVDGRARTDTLATWHADAGSGPDDRAWSVAAAALAARRERMGTNAAGRGPGPARPAPDRATRGRAGFRLNAAPSLRVRIDEEVRAVAPAPASTVREGWDWAPGPDGSALLDVSGTSARADLAPPPTIEAAVRSAHPVESGEIVIRAPMPGSVLGVRVADGDAVEAHQVLVVLEAMKMENAISAPVDGRVVRVHARSGETVQRGDVLVELA